MQTAAILGEFPHQEVVQTLIAHLETSTIGGYLLISLPKGSQTPSLGLLLYLQYFFKHVFANC